MGISWNGKRRWIALLLLIAGIVVTIAMKPIIPVIQLPGEVWPNGWMTNTLFGSIIVWILLILLIVYVQRAMPKGSSEVPRGGFYNLFELAFEGLYGFIRNIVGTRYIRLIFSVFMTIFLIVLLSNWIELIPGVDSIGFLHAHVEVDEETGEVHAEEGFETTGTGIYVLNPTCPWISPEEAAVLTAEEQAGRAQAGCVTGTGAPVPEAHEESVAVVEGETTIDEAVVVDGEGETAGETTAEAATVVASEGEDTSALDEAVEPTDAEVVDEVLQGEGQVEEAHDVHATPGDPNVPWHIIPFLRAPSTDLNMTLSLALVAVVMTQVIGFRALGLSYLTKFFNFRTLFTSPLGGIDVAVGLLELIGEIARILSFTFRLLGNIFAGSILLFVMSFLIPFLPWPFFILEFFVGAIQALVFGLLTAIFMNLATASHHPDEHHPEEAVPVEAPTIGEQAEVPQPAH